METSDLARKQGISEATLYDWKAEYAADVSDAKRPEPLEDDNGRLKRLLADAIRDASTLRGFLAKNGEAHDNPSEFGGITRPTVRQSQSQLPTSLGFVVQFFCKDKSKI